MSAYFLAFLQAVAAVPPGRIDLLVLPHCEAQKSTDNEIVVCGRRNEGKNPYRLEATTSPSRTLPNAETQLTDDVSTAAETEGVNVGGQVSNRIMLRLKVKF